MGEKINKQSNNKQLAVRIIAGIVIISAVVVIFGWIFNIPILKSFFPGMVEMRFLAAVSFLFSGIMLLFMLKISGNMDLNNVIVLIGLTLIILIMGLLLISSFLGISLGIENTFINEASGAVKTVSPGMPSIGAIINFILIGIAGFLWFFPLKSKAIRMLGVIVVVISAIALIGYAISQPFLYYSFEGFSKALALNASILFVLVGIALYIIGGDEV
ncbi:hypothetical protein HYW76_00155 [Candidatus Pacearchaeota archaeon]|nr:hypothetical protein [Candidatus Pacearchaeota archaeon]